MFRPFNSLLLIVFCTFKLAVADIYKAKSNLLLCLSEDHAAHLFNSLENYGSTINPTPHLSRIAQTGYFHQLAYCTNATSRDTAFSIQTGLVKSSNLETYNHSQFIAHFFKKLGYETAFFGSWTWKKKPKIFGFSYWNILDDPEIFFNPKILDSKGARHIEGHSTDIITDLAIRWIRKERNSEKPFFVIVSYQGTRRPWIPPIRKIDHYNNEWFESPDNFFTNFTTRTPANKYQRMNIAQDLDIINDLFLNNPSEENITATSSTILSKNLVSMNDEQKSAWKLAWKPQNEAFDRESHSDESLAIWKFQRFFKNYLRCILAMDENIGRLVESIPIIEKNGLNFIYTSERGRFTGEFGWFGSEWMYEPSARVPLILSSFQGTNFPEIASDKLFLDIDLYNLMRNWSYSLRNEFYFTHYDYPGKYSVCPHRGLRKERYKIIHYYPFNEWEFYDLIIDPKEEENLYRQNAYNTLIKEYKELLNEYTDHTAVHEPRVLFPETWKRAQRSPNKKTR